MLLGLSLLLLVCVCVAAHHCSQLILVALSLVVLSLVVLRCELGLGSDIFILLPEDTHDGSRHKQTSSRCKGFPTPENGGVSLPLCYERGDEPGRPKARDCRHELMSLNLRLILVLRDRVIVRRAPILKACICTFPELSQGQGRWLATGPPYHQITEIYGRWNSGQRTA